MDISLKEGKKIYFASDFHLGTPDHESSLEREKKIVRWLDEISDDAQAIFLLGDIFDFWFEYSKAIPKGFNRFIGKLAELTDQGIDVIFFTGNHDMWMFNYFPDEFGIPIYRKPIDLNVNSKKFHIGHGDGLGPGDFTYKLLKKIFQNKLCQWLFARLHPNFGIGIAQFWSRRSRIASGSDMKDFGEKEWILTYCKEVEEKAHRDYYIFGHRHLYMERKVSDNSTYYNLGEWVNESYYGVFDGHTMEIKSYQG